MVSDAIRDEIAVRTIQCFKNGTQVPLLNSSYPDIEVEDSYPIQERLVASL